MVIISTCSLWITPGLSQLLNIFYISTFSTCWYYESEGIMGPHTTLTPKIFKLDVHLGYMQVPLSTNFPIKTCLL